MKWLLGLTRYMVLLGVGGSLFAAATLFLSGFLQIGTIGALRVRALDSPKDLKLLAIEVIHLADYFLIATALYIVAVGLHELFIGEVNLPDRLAWLRSPPSPLAPAVVPTGPGQGDGPEPSAWWPPAWPRGAGGEETVGSRRGWAAASNP
jgi:hypothetical protein